MTTRLYFHAAASPDGFIGFPSPKSANSNIGIGQTSETVASVATTSSQLINYSYFFSQKLSGPQTIGSGNMTWNFADAESNLSMNHWINALQISVYDPISGTQRGTYIHTSSIVEGSAGTNEPSSASSEQVTNLAVTPAASVSAQDGDVIIIEVTAKITQAMATSYNGIFYYDGTTVNNTENAAVSNHASYVEFAENLVFQGAPAQVPFTPTPQLGPMLAS